ncbi:MAG: hypothetical protein P857_950 [Candidatus Xenolissoclinum pacificiensis L6]|uniref:Uncharacterized protein n=1 Tax=Candidatus Xenolissoclinum pacificiensis L6 TaxID=1401685 RepID=W2V109_9RICK|nr:MAG: hypothetical protein P857_950 [Candidatus Xenolissoclinum pacificiensis L6]
MILTVITIVLAVIFAGFLLINYSGTGEIFIFLLLYDFVIME